jgi:hypothetical protein
VGTVETELFVHFAEIAGVFIGFGALISLRSAHVTDVHDVVYLQAVLALGVWVVVSSLVPVVVSRYGVVGHGLWLPSAVVALVIWLAFLAAFARRSDTRALNRSQEPLDRFFPVVGLPLHLVIAGSLALIVLGRWPSTEPALYVTALAAGVVFAGYTLLVYVMSQKHDTTSGRDSA